MGFFKVGIWVFLGGFFWVGFLMPTLGLILGPVHWITEPAWAPDPDTALLAVAFRMPKMSFFPKFFCFISYFGYGTLTSVFKDNMSFRSHKRVEIMVYLNFLLPDPRGPKTYGSYGSGTLLKKNHITKILDRVLLFELCLMLLALRPGLLVTARAEISAMVAPA